MNTEVVAGRYHILQRIGQGGAAEVFKAMDTRLERLVALKILRENYSQDPSFIRRFENEAKIAARLSHPAIVDVYDYEYTDGRYVIAMEYVPGQTLKEYLAARAPLPEAEARRLVSRVLEGLAVAHEAGLVHRDMKPQNVLIAPDGRLKIADFGIAKVADEQGITQGMLTLGTPHYLSPEQAFGEQVTPRTDLYAVGVMLYEMLAGRLPFEGYSALRTAYAHLFDQPTPLRDIAPGVSPAMAAAVERAMAKDPQERFPSARSMLAALAEAPDVQTPPTPSHPDTSRAGGMGDTKAEALPPTRASRGRNARRLKVLLAAVSLLALVAAGLIALLNGDGGIAGRDRPQMSAGAPGRAASQVTTTPRDEGPLSGDADRRAAPTPSVGGTQTTASQAPQGGASPSAVRPIAGGTASPTQSPEPEYTAAPSVASPLTPGPVSTPVTIIDGRRRTVRLETGNLLGGDGSPGGRYEGLTARLMSGSGTRYARISARFRIDEQPDGDERGNVGFGFVGLDLRGPGAARLRVEVNGRLLPLRPAPRRENVAGEWDSYAVAFPVSYLRRGENVVTVTGQAREGSPERGPWFALHNAVVVYYVR